MIRRLLLSLSILLAGAGLCLSLILVRADDPRLQLVGYAHEWKGKPATALVYDLYLNHRPKHIFFVWNGQRIGSEYLWYDNGQMMARRPHAQGLPDGAWTMWYEDGKPKSLKTYKLGIIDGEVWAWHSNGQISDYNLYKEGQEITHKSWVFDGTPYYNYVYQDGRKVGIKGGDFCKRLEVLKR